ncbi:MAG: hypothetical protein EBS19_16310, partial [Spirochaetia bacterium]|nr:hypothetical protein [Spirochaetia bacterium]
RSNFAKIGVYDYNHLSDIYEIKMLSAMGKELLEFQLLKEQSIIGYPERKTELAIGLKDEFPTSFGLTEEGVYSYGYIIPDKEISKEVIKGIKAGMPYGASVSGVARKEDVQNNTIKKITLRKIAIAPLGDVINQDTFVSLAKSKMVELNNIVKSLNGLEELSNKQINQLSMINDSKLESKLDAILKVLYKSDLTRRDFLEVISEEIEENLQKSYIRDPLGLSDYLVSKYSIPSSVADKIAKFSVED